MQNIIQKSFLITFVCTLTSLHAITVNTNSTQEQSSKELIKNAKKSTAHLHESYHKSIFEKIKNGICPDGLEYTCSILAGGCAALPGAAAYSALQKNFSDIPNSLSLSIPIISGAVASYTFYRMHQTLKKRTREEILKQKAFLLEEINKLKVNQILSENSIIKQLNLIFTDDVANGASSLMLINLYLQKIIKEIKWINPKIIFLGENPIDQKIIELLQKTRSNIVTSPDYLMQRTIHQKHEKELYDDQLSTKIKRGAWWTTKKTAQAGFFAAKVSAYVCWDLFKIILSNVARTII